jgi:hypothetical protein
LPAFQEKPGGIANRTAERLKGALLRVGTKGGNPEALDAEHAFVQREKVFRLQKNLHPHQFSTEDER